MQLNSILLIGCMVFCHLSQRAQDDAKKVYEGNELYYSGKLSPSALMYRQALEKNPLNRKANFNLGVALYKSALLVKSGNMEAPVNATVTTDSIGNMMLDKAAENFAVVANSVSDKDTLHRAWHNIGNCYLHKKEFRQAAEAYKKSLRFDPKDEETRYNLAYALKNMPPEEKSGGGGQQNEQQPQQDKKDQQQEQQQQQQQSQMSKDQAEQLLQALMNAEKKLQDKRKQKTDHNPKKVEKDW